MNGKSEFTTKRKAARKMSGWIITLVIVAILGIGGAIGWSFLSKEHTEARNVPLNGADFNKLKDGTYVGEYAGGMYKWRENKVEVTIDSGKVKGIKLLGAQNKNLNNASISAPLYERVIKAQSLEVDTISGATLDTKAYLKAVEAALVKAQKK
jgi:uncharacterized protein with FMN-binding domain